MSTNDKRVREFAYQIWESEGKPEGQEARHWEMACKLAEAEALAPTQPARPRKTNNSKTNSDKTASSKPAAAKPKAKPAAADKVVAPPVKKAAAEKKPRAPRKPAS